MKHLFTTLCIAGASIFSTAFAADLENYTLDPAGGSTVKTLSEIKITFPDFDVDSDYIFTANSGKGHITNGTVTYNVDPASVSGPKNEKTLIFRTQEGDDVTIKEAGEWTLTLDQGFGHIWDWDTDETIEESPVITAVYTVEGGESEGDEGGENGGEEGDQPWLNLNDWISYPADGATVPEITRLSVCFPDFVSYGDWGMLKANVGRITLSDGKKPYTVSFGMQEGPADQGFNNNNAKGFYAKDEEGEQMTITTPGTYTWTFGEGAFQSLDDDDEVLAESPAFTIVLTIEGEVPVDPLEYTFSPESGSTVDFPEENLIIALDFPNATSVSTEAVEVESPFWGDIESRGCRVTYGSDMIARVADLSVATGYSVTAEGHTLLFTFSKEIFKANGTLSIDADEGAFGVDDNDDKLAAPAFTYSLKVGEAKDYEYTISPESGTEAETFDTFTISFPTASSAKFNEGSYIVLVGPRTLTQYECIPVDGAKHPTFELTFDPAPYQHGNYTLTVGEGAFILDDNYTSPEMSASYTLLRTSQVITTITPSPKGAKVVASEYGTFVNFLFADDEKVSGTENWINKVEVKFDDTVLTAGTDYAISLGYNDDTYYVLNINIEGDNNEYVGKTGTLSVKAPEGTFTISGESSPAFEKTWQVIAPRTYEYTFSPAENEATASLSEITITFLEAEEVEVFRNSFVNLREINYDSFFNLTEWSAKKSENGASVVLKFNPGPTTESSYVLTCDYSAFVIDGGIESPGIDATFILDKESGLTVIEAVDGLYTVYSLDGKLIIDRVESRALNSLEPGLYIINGKKVNLK